MSLAKKTGTASSPIAAKPLLNIPTVL